MDLTADSTHRKKEAAQKNLRYALPDELDSRFIISRRGQ